MNNINKLYKTTNIINFNEYTKNIEHWNPFEQNIDISFFNNKLYYFILGPINNENLRYLWKFRINYNSNQLILNSIENSKNSDPCINIIIENKIGKINYINQCGDYRGRDLIDWMLKIMENLGCSKSILIDVAEKKCIDRNYTNYVPLSLIHKLWKGQTYYEYFGFIPYNKNDNHYKINKLLELNNNMNELYQLKWTDFNIDDEKWKLFQNKYCYIYDSPFLAYKEFTFNNCNIFYDILYLLEENNQKCSIILQKIKNIISKSVWMKTF